MTTGKVAVTPSSVTREKATIPQSGATSWKDDVPPSRVTSGNVAILLSSLLKVSQLSHLQV